MCFIEALRPQCIHTTHIELYFYMKNGKEDEYDRRKRAGRDVNSVVATSLTSLTAGLYLLVQSAFFIKEISKGA